MPDLLVKKERRTLTLGMSDHDYASLLDAVGWIEHPSAVDAPDYPHRDRLAEVVNNISKRRQPDAEVAPQPARWPRTTPSPLPTVLNGGGRFAGQGLPYPGIVRCPGEPHEHEDAD